MPSKGSRGLSSSNRTPNSLAACCVSLSSKLITGNTVLTGTAIAGVIISSTTVSSFLSAITVVLGGIAGFLLSEKIGESIVFLLPFAAGNFIYIAASDLIPEIKQKLSIKKSLIYFIVFLSGIMVMLLTKLLFNH